MFTKYQKVEDANVVSPQGHKTVEQELHKTGKTTMRELSEDERKRIVEQLDKSE